MTLLLSNNPDIALAQEWTARLRAWIRQHDLSGFDPFDIKAHPWIRAMQSRPLPRKTSSAFCDLFPRLARRCARVQPALNPKAPALVALAEMRLFEITDDARHLDEARRRLEQLESIATPGFAGLCWGYPFPVHAAGLNTPAGAPVAVVSAIAGEAFLRAHALLGDSRYLDAARSVARFMLADLPRIPCDDDVWCFAYTPNDRRRVHNANLLTAAFVLQTAQALDNRQWADEVEPALRFTLNAQREDGAWPYGAWREGEPYEPGLLRLVDHHHTGFVLRSLHQIHRDTGREDIRERMVKGYRFYTSLIRDNGMPVNEYGPWPVDIHACAEGILCPSVLADTCPGALQKALLVMRWTHQYLRNSADSAPKYRKYPGICSSIVFPRWGVAWMYRALTEYLYACRHPETTPPPPFARA